MSRIKICGLRRPEDIAAVNEARPDYCGFIVEYPKSRRSIDRATKEYIQELKVLTEKPLIQAFSIKSKEDVERARESVADYILLDQGSGGTGKVFDWSLVDEVGRPYFLAGGLDVENLREAIGLLHPWAVDLSSSLEIDGMKNAGRICQAVEIVRMEETKDVKR